ncbi:MAG: hypothetical protein B6242_00995 [Anaerolineaceae bacterium 4572_78]|nr:MAG: hypothetical protein B6242_00995 [Anaerolineaceae bacterium 4572_78]
MTKDLKQKAIHHIARRHCPYFGNDSPLPVVEESTEQDSPFLMGVESGLRATDIFSKLLPWLVILILIMVAIILWQPLLTLITNPDPITLRAEVDRLGALAPFAFIALSILQIVGAPIPGYPVQILGGILFGTVWGGIYNVVGLLAGGMTAAWLARTLGRPFIQKNIAPETLAKYEGLAKLETVWMWFIIFNIPIGDIPYFIAGLSRIKLSSLAIAILLSRGPASFAIAWIGATSLSFPTWILFAMTAIIFAVIGLAYLFKGKINTWIEKHILPSLT